MNAVLRALPLVLAATLVAAPLRAESLSGDRPAIFSAPVVTKAPAATKLETHSLAPLSPHIRAALNERALANQAPLPAVAPSDPGLGPMVLTQTDAIVMERYVLNLSPLRRVELPPPESGLLRFVKTGTFFRYRGSKVDAEGEVHILQLKPLGVSKQESFFRAEVAFHLNW